MKAGLASVRPRQRDSEIPGRPLQQILRRRVVKQFSDLAEYAWSKEAVETLAGKGFVRGRGEGRFDPGAVVTGAEFSALVTRMLKYQAPSGAGPPFADVTQDSWYQDAVTAAYTGGLISGRSAGQFEPEGNINRQEMALTYAPVKSQVKSDFVERNFCFLLTKY